MPGQHRREGRHQDDIEQLVELFAWARLLIEIIVIVLFR
jgi:hypothetical protein